MIIRGGTSSNSQIRLSTCSYTSCAFHLMKIHQHCKHLGLNFVLKISSSAFDWLVKKLFRHFWPHRQRKLGSSLKKTPLITNTHNHPQTKLTKQNSLCTGTIPWGYIPFQRMFRGTHGTQHPGESKETLPNKPLPCSRPPPTQKLHLTTIR